MCEESSQEDLQTQVFKDSKAHSQRDDDCQWHCQRNSECKALCNTFNLNYILFCQHF